MELVEGDGGVGQVFGDALLADHPGHRVDRHGRDHGHDHRLEQQGEAAARPRPRHADLLDAALRAADARHAGVQPSVVLEEIEMAPVRPLSFVGSVSWGGQLAAPQAGQAKPTSARPRATAGWQLAAPQAGQAKRLPGAKSIWMSSRRASESKSLRSPSTAGSGRAPVAAGMCRA